MPLELTCPTCQVSQRVRDELAGTWAACVVCNAAMFVSPVVPAPVIVTDAHKKARTDSQPPAPVVCDVFVVRSLGVILNGTLTLVLVAACVAAWHALQPVERPLIIGVMCIFIAGAVVSVLSFAMPRSAPGFRGVRKCGLAMNSGANSLLLGALAIRPASELIAIAVCLAFFSFNLLFIKYRPPVGEEHGRRVELPR